MAIAFDNDPLGSILEYGHLHKHRTDRNSERERRAWTAANLGNNFSQDPWMGYGIHERQLVDALGPGRGYENVQRVVRRAMEELRAKHLIESLASDANPATDWFEITESKAAGTKIRHVKPILQFRGGLVQLGFNVGTRTNGVDQPR